MRNICRLSVYQQKKKLFISWSVYRILNKSRSQLMLSTGSEKFDAYFDFRKFFWIL